MLILQFERYLTLDQSQWAETKDSWRTECKWPPWKTIHSCQPSRYGCCMFSSYCPKDVWTSSL